MGSPKKQENLFESYVESLAEKLGPHYRYEHYSDTNWLGFIYCECYYGKDFVAWPASWSETRKDPGYGSNPPPMLIPGAVARVEQTRIIVLDVSREYHKNRSPKRSDRSKFPSDAIIVEAASPNFNEEFMKIKCTHDKNVKYFKVKNVYEKSEGVR